MNIFSKRTILMFCIFFLALVVSIFFGLAVGSSSINITEILNFLFNSDTIDSLSTSIILNIRLPRVVMAFLVGAALSLGGLVLQVLLRNPLAEPYILGISGGSAVGAILGIMAGFTRFPGITLMAFASSLFTIGLLLLLASGKFLLNKNSLLLTGVMVNSFCSAIIMFLISIADNSKLYNIMFWLMGDFSVLSLDGVSTLAVVLLICAVILFWCSNWMNLLQLGHDMAHSMGIHVKRASIILLLSTSLMVSVTVSYCGLIGFVGLVVPHILRLVFTTDHRLLVPACVLCGSTYIIICDVIARVLLDHGELPTGAVTALIGAPVFIYLLVVRSES